MDVLTASWSIEDIWKWLKKLCKMLEHVSECLESRSREDSPDRPGEKPKEPDSEAVIPGSTHCTYIPACTSSNSTYLIKHLMEQCGSRLRDIFKLSTQVCIIYSIQVHVNYLPY